MTPKEAIEADRATDVPGGLCALDAPCRCPTCDVAQALLRVKLVARGIRDFDIKRVTLRANDFAGGANPYIASVRVDGREVYRIHVRPDEVFDPEVLDDITKALRRPM